MLTSSVISPQLQTALEVQAYKEGLLTRSDYSYGQLHDIPERYEDCSADPRILTYLCLFPSIDVTRSDFILRGLCDKTGLEISTIEPRSVRRLTLCEYDRVLSEAEFSRLLASCHNDILRICAAQQFDLIALVEGHIAITADFGLYDGNYGERGDIRHICQRSFIPTMEALAGWYGSDMAATPCQGLGFDIELTDGTLIPKWVVRDRYFEMWLDKVDDLYVRLLAAFFYSKLEGKSLSPGRWWQRKSGRISDTELGVDVARMMAIKFREELRVVPEARSISEAVDIGHSREMKRLREKIAEWIDCMDTDRLHLESRIRSDISKASRELRRLRRYKEVADSPFVFGTKLVLGQVPFISNVLSIVEASAWAYEKWSAGRNCWVVVERTNN